MYGLLIPLQAILGRWTILVWVIDCNALWIFIKTSDMEQIIISLNIYSLNVNYMHIAIQLCFKCIAFHSNIHGVCLWSHWSSFLISRIMREENIINMFIVCTMPILSPRRISFLIYDAMQELGTGTEIVGIPIRDFLPMFLPYLFLYMHYPIQTPTAQT